MNYTEKYGASYKYNKSLSYIYFRKGRWDGSMESLAYRSRRLHVHSKEHTEAELKLIWDMHRRDSSLGLIELWHRLKQHGYNPPASLLRVMRKLGMFLQKKKKKSYSPKPYQLMPYPSHRIQIEDYQK